MHVHVISIKLKIHVSLTYMCSQINADSIDFRKWYKSEATLKEDERNDLFPPRFKLKINCYNASFTLDFRYTVCVGQEHKENIHLQLNIFVKGRHTIQGLLK